MLKVLFLSLSIFFLVGCGNGSKTDVKIDYVPDSLTIMYMDGIEQLDALSVQQVEALRNTSNYSSFPGDSNIYNFFILFEITSDKNLQDYFKRNLSTVLIDTRTNGNAIRKDDNTYYVFYESKDLYLKNFFSDESYSLDLSIEFYYDSANGYGFFGDNVINSSNKITISKDDLSNLLDSFGIPYNLPERQ